MRALELHEEGKTYDQIAQELGVTKRTVISYIHAARKARGETRKVHFSRGSLAERFWSKVDKSGPLPEHQPELGPCWIWAAGVAVRGYGAISDTRGEMGPANAKYRAHRLAVMLTGVTLTDEVVVMHRCDRPSCVNLAHLKIGTQADNMADKDEKGRTFRRTLTEEQRARVTELRAAGWPFKRIAAEFGMALNTLTRILTESR